MHHLLLRAHKKGQQKLAFFAALCICSAVAHGQWLDPGMLDWTDETHQDTESQKARNKHRLLIHAESSASHAPLRPSHWARQGVQQNGQTYGWRWEQRALVQWQGPFFALHTGHAQQGQLLANQNALYFASQANGQIDTTAIPNGNHVLEARLWQLEGTVFGAVFAGQWGNGLRWQWMPEVMKIDAHRQDHAEAVWQQSAQVQQLSGRLTQTGTQSFGFLMDDRPDAGWAAMAHFKLDGANEWGSAGLQINNVVNRLFFSAVHHASTDYRLEAVDGKLAVGDLPSVSGDYGVHAWRGRLPKVWNWHFSPRWLPSLSMGQMGIAQHRQFFAALTHAMPAGEIRLQTVGSGHFSLNWGGVLLASRLKVGTGFMADTSFKSVVWNGAYVQWQW